MATKKTTPSAGRKKSTTKKPRPTARKKAVAKKSTKQSATAASPAFMQLAYALFASAITYGFASWAIDSGSLWLYLATFIGLYLVVSYIAAFVKLQFLNK